MERLGVDADLSQSAENLRPSRRFSDIAYLLLKEKKEPIKYQDLAMAVLEKAGIPDGENRAKLLAKIHTEVNMDSRFQPQGKGLCGLKEWSHKPAPYKVVEIPRPEPQRTSNRLRKELELLDETAEPGAEEEEHGEPEEPQEPEGEF